MRQGAWLAATIALLLLGYLLHQSLLFTISLALLLAAGLARLWNRYCFTGLEYRREISPRRAFIGEDVSLVTEVVNRKLLPLPWLEVQDEFPDELPITGGHTSPSHRPKRYQLANLLSLRWYERVRRHYRLRCTARGYYDLGPVRIRSGDIFGLALNDKEEEIPDRILVYPKIVPISALGLPSVHPFGEMRARQPLFEDPMRTVGVRPYTYGDSMRRLHWKATAHTQKLQSRVYETTTTLRLVLFLNLNTLGPRWWWQGQNPAVLELAVTVAASMANWGIEQGYQVGLYANGTARRSDEKVRVPPGRDPAQLVAILESLARVLPFANAPMEELLRMESGSLPWGSTVVLVTAIVTEEIAAILERLQAAGHKVVVLIVGEGETRVDVALWSEHVRAAEEEWLPHAANPTLTPVLYPAAGDRSEGPAPSPLRGEGSPVPGNAPSPLRGEGWGEGRSAATATPPPLGADGLPRMRGVQVHHVKVSWREIRDLQFE